MAHPPNDPCPCQSGRKYKKCCGPLHAGAPAPTAEALMRSRYAAYALGLAPYLVATTHPSSPHQEPDRAAWLDEIRAFCAAMAFEGLTVRAAREEGDRGVVEFEARMRHDGRDATMQERSRFERVGGRWLYHSGDRLPA